MFNLFKRNLVANWERELMIRIFDSLPAEYKGFKDQVGDGLLRRVSYGSPVTDNYVGFSYFPEVSGKYENERGGFFKLEEIKVFDQLTCDYICMEIYCSNGLIMGYAFPKSAKYKLDVTRIDTSRFRKRYFGNKDYEEFSEILTPAEKKMVISSEIYKVELNNDVYYHLKEIGDGDFLAMDRNRNIYKITHDPFEITSLDGISLKDIFM